MGRRKLGKPPIRPFKTYQEELRFFRRLMRRYPTDTLTELYADNVYFNKGNLRGARILRGVWKKRQNNPDTEWRIQ